MFDVSFLSRYLRSVEIWIIRDVVYLSYGSRSPLVRSNIINSKLSYTPFSWKSNCDILFRWRSIFLDITFYEKNPQIVIYDEHFEIEILLEGEMKHCHVYFSRFPFLKKLTCLLSQIS